MHLTDSEKAAAESWGPALLFQPSAQLFFKPSFNLTQLLLFLSLLVRNRWQIPLYHQAPESVTHYIKVGGSSVVLLWSFCCVLLRIFFTIMCGCIWTDSRNGMGCVLEMIAERKQRAPHTPFLREKKNRQSSDLTLDISQLPWDSQYSIRQLSQNWLPGCSMISRIICIAVCIEEILNIWRKLDQKNGTKMAEKKKPKQKRFDNINMSLFHKSVFVKNYSLQKKCSIFLILFSLWLIRRHNYIQEFSQSCYNLFIDLQ